MGDELKPEGMTLRDYLAAQALVGILSGEESNFRMSENVKEAYKYASLMMLARENLPVEAIDWIKDFELTDEEAAQLPSSNNAD